MITLQNFRDRTRHLPPDTELGISHDDHLGHDAIVLRQPGNPMETVVDCGELGPLEEDESKD